jgi:DNA (cytosine-5)-methyltransferase 1
VTALKVGGQCEGYAGIFQALQTLLPVEHAWYAELDENASMVLAHHYPGVPNHGDITTYDWSTAEPVEIFTSGFPCTDISLAGKQEGSSGKHHLWPTGVRPALEALRPPLAIFENVANLLRIEDGQLFAKVLADLDDLGYTVSWTTVGACRVGACHHRHRVFIAATLTEVPAPMSDPIAHRSGDGWGPTQFVLFGDAGAVRWPIAGFTSGGTAWEMPADMCGATGPVLNTPTVEDAARYGSEEWAARWAAGEAIPETHQRLRTQVLMLPTPRTSDTNGAGMHGDGGLDLRTAVSMLPTPLAQDAARNRTSPGDLARKSPALEAVVSMLPTPTATSYGNNQSPSAGTSVRPSLDGIAQLLPTPRASDGEKGGPNQRGSSGDVMLPAAVQPERFGKYAAAVHRHERAYGLAAPDPTEPGRNGKPRLSAAFPEFMQGLPPGWLTDVVDRKAALKLAGNGVNPRQCAFALSLLPTFRAAVAELTRERVAA